MRGVQYVFRRGAVYWWRRRLLQKVGERERAPIALSLGTRELFKARVIGAHLAVASDGILRQEGRKMLSATQARSMLEVVARTHLVKMDRLAVLETADGVRAEEGRSSDRVTGWARRLQAVQGMFAIVGDAERRMLEENGLTQLEIDEVGQVLGLFRRASNGSLPRQRLKALLVECGASEGEGDLLQAERIYYRGQAAALLATDRRWGSDFREDDALIEDILQRNERPRLQETAPAMTATRRDFASPGAQQDTPQSELAHPQTHEPPTDITSITKLTDKMISEKSALGEWNAKTQRQVRSVIATFVEMVGDDHVRSLSQSRVAEYRSLLLALPRSYGKGQHDKDTPLAVWLERAKGLKKEQKGRAAGTLNRHLTQLQEVLMYIAAQGNKIPDFTGVSNLRAKQSGRPRDQRNPFSPEDLPRGSVKIPRVWSLETPPLDNRGQRR